MKSAISMPNDVLNSTVQMKDSSTSHFTKANPSGQNKHHKFTGIKQTSCLNINYFDYGLMKSISFWFSCQSEEVHVRKQADSLCSVLSTAECQYFYSFVFI